MKKYAIAGVAVLAILYVLGYVGIRQSYAEVWEHDGNTYVLFPSSGLYYLFRPATYLDAAVTGMRFHIGPHQ